MPVNGRMYSATYQGSVGTAACDLIELSAASAKNVCIHAVFIENTSDVDSEQIRISLSRFTSGSTSGSGGSSVTPVPMVSTDTAAGAACEANNTSRCSGGTQTYIMHGGFNVINGWSMIFTPEMRPWLVAQERFVVGSESTLADAITFAITVFFEELG